MGGYGSHSQGRAGIGTLTSQYQSQCFFQAVMLQAFSRLTVRVEHISQSHKLRCVSTPALATNVPWNNSLTLSGFGYLFTQKSWPVCPFSNDILRSDTGPTHTHTHTHTQTWPQKGLCSSMSSNPPSSSRTVHCLRSSQVQIPLFNMQSPTIAKLPFPPEHSLV